MEGRTGSFDNSVIDPHRRFCFGEGALILGVKRRHGFYLYQWFRVELNTWVYRKLSRVTAVSIVLGLEIRSKSGIQFEVRINFR
jgi:hypothetical protein